MEQKPSMKLTRSVLEASAAIEEELATEFPWTCEAGGDKQSATARRSGSGGFLDEEVAGDLIALGCPATTPYSLVVATPPLKGLKLSPRLCKVSSNGISFSFYFPLACN